MPNLSQVQKEVSDFIREKICNNGVYQGEVEAVASHFLQNVAGDIALLDKNTQKTLLLYLSGKYDNVNGIYLGEDTEELPTLEIGDLFDW